MPNSELLWEEKEKNILNGKTLQKNLILALNLKHKEFLDTLKICAYDKKCVEKSVNIEKELMRNGRVINKLDIVIASICLSHEAKIITLDRDFSKISELKSAIF